MHSPTRPAFYRFGPFVLDLNRRALLHGGAIVHLSPRSFDLLAYLVEQDGRLVTREDLEERVWDGASVKDANICKHIQLVRQALGDTIKPYVYVRTVQSRGFQFAGAEPADNPFPAQPALDVSRAAAVELLSIALHFQKIGTSAAIASAITCLQQAQALQTGIPDVPAALAWLHVLKAVHGFGDPAACLQETRAYAQHALEADPRAGGAWLAEAAFALFAERNASRAVEILSDAADTAQNDTRWPALHVLALCAAERFGEAIARAREMSARFPGSVTAAHVHALAHYYAGGADDASAHSKRLLAFRPECGSARLLLAYCDTARGEFDAARQHLTQILMPRPSYAAALERFRQPAIAALAYVEGKAGDVDGAHALQADLRAHPVPSYCALAVAAMGSDDESLVFDYLKRAYQAREPWSMFLALDPLYKAWFAGRRQRAS